MVSQGAVEVMLERMRYDRVEEVRKKTATRKFNFACGSSTARRNKLVEKGVVDELRKSQQHERLLEVLNAMKDVLQRLS